MNKIYVFKIILANSRMIQRYNTIYSFIECDTAMLVQHPNTLISEGRGKILAHTKIIDLCHMLLTDTVNTG